MFVIVQECLFVVFPVKNGEPNNWQGCEDDIVELVEPHIIDRGGAKGGYKAKHPNWYNVNHILVEHVRDQVRVATVSFTTMHKKQIL